MQLIGLGIAVDYSLLDRLPLPRGARSGQGSKDDGDRAHDGDRGPRGRLLGRAVALGLALLIAMPLPFMRCSGVAGFLIPIVSILGAR